MRFSLVYSASLGSGAVRSQRYTALEQHAIAAELCGFSALWLDSSSENGPASSTLRLLQQLSNATDRIDLGIVAHIPEPSGWARFLEDVQRLDDLSSGRLRLAFTANNDPTAMLAFATQVAEALRVQYMPWLSRRIVIEAEDTTVAEAGARGFGLYMPPSDASVYAHSVQLARYHDAREEQLGWVTRQRTVALMEPEATHSRISQPQSDMLPTTRGYEPPLAGTATDIVSQCAVVQLADGIDEMMCRLHLSDTRIASTIRTIEVLGRDVIPHFVGHESPHSIVRSVSIPLTWTDTPLRVASVRNARQRTN